MTSIISTETALKFRRKSTSQLHQIATDRLKITVGTGIAALLAGFHNETHEITKDLDVERRFSGDGLRIGGLCIGTGEERMGFGSG